MWKRCVWLVVDSFINAANVVNCVISEVVDRQISGIMSWRSCYKNIVHKHENAL